MTVVLDASALLAVINGERGAEEVRRRLVGASMTSVNLAEVGSRMIDLGEDVEQVNVALRMLGINVIDFDEQLAMLVVELRAGTRRDGLSIGDRACLALAIREQAIALTADRAWSKLNVGCEIELIR